MNKKRNKSELESLKNSKKNSAQLDGTRKDVSRANFVTPDLLKEIEQKELELAEQKRIELAEQKRTNRLIKERIKQARKRDGYRPLKPRPDDEPDSESQETQIANNK